MQLLPLLHLLKRNISSKKKIIYFHKNSPTLYLINAAAVRYILRKKNILTKSET